MPSFYDADFARHDEAMLAEDFGELVIYVAVDGEEQRDEKAIVDWEATASGGTDEGITARPRRPGSDAENVRVRRFGLRLSKVPIVDLYTVCKHGGLEWPVVHIMGSDSARTYVECQRVETHHHGVGYQGP